MRGVQIVFSQRNYPETLASHKVVRFARGSGVGYSFSYLRPGSVGEVGVIVNGRFYSLEKVVGGDEELVVNLEKAAQA